MTRLLMTLCALCLLVSTAHAVNFFDCHERLAFVDARQGEYRLGWTLHDSLAYVRGMTLDAQWESAAWWTRHTYKYADLPGLRDLVWHNCLEQARKRAGQTIVRDPNRY